jgi:hypothetical protein
MCSSSIHALRKCSVWLPFSPDTPDCFLRRVAELSSPVQHKALRIVWALSNHMGLKGCASNVATLKHARAGMSLGTFVTVKRGLEDEHRMDTFFQHRVL